MGKAQLIYYIDDDTDDLTLMESIAEQLGHIVITFTNIDTMLQALTSAIPEIIFLDEFMPERTGSNVITELKQRKAFKNIILILMSGSYLKENITKILDAGANYIIEKPHTLPQYKEMIQHVTNIDWKTYTAKAEDFIR